MQEEIEKIEETIEKLGPLPINMPSFAVDENGEIQKEEPFEPIEEEELSLISE